MNSVYISFFDMALHSTLPASFSTTAAAAAAAASSSHKTLSLSLSFTKHQSHPPIFCHTSRSSTTLVLANKEDTEVEVNSLEQQESESESDPDPQDLEYVNQIKRVLELLKKNRDMLFSEVKLTVMIEDPRDVERRRLLGIDDIDAPTRDELADALEEVNEGKIPKDRVVLQMLAEEMMQWPNLEVEIKKKGPRKSLYAKATDTGVDPEVAAKRLKIDWDSAAEIDDSDIKEERDVPSVLGFGALYLVSAFPIIIDHPVAEEAYIQLAAVFTKVRKQNQSEFFTIEKPQVPMEGTLQKERQISVDPVSMKESRKPPLLIESPKKESGMLLPVIASPKGYGMPPLPLPPGKSRFLSYSLPGSAASSPKFSSAIPKKKPHSEAFNPLAQHSVALARLAQLSEKHLERSKSCGESRISAVNDEFDLWLTSANSRRYSNPSRTETRNDRQHGRQDMQDTCDEDNFKCGAMCLFLPSFGKGKPVRSRKELPEKPHVISRSVSLEKFECASWTSSALMHDNGNGDSSKFFDLPLELIQCSENEANLPVRAAFVFEKDRKGAMKNGASRGTGRKSHESSRRFSSSSKAPHQPTSTSPSPCITPRLLKAREDFNAFLEAQSAQ